MIYDGFVVVNNHCLLSLLSLDSDWSEGFHKFSYNTTSDSQVTSIVSIVTKNEL